MDTIRAAVEKDGAEAWLVGELKDMLGKKSGALRWVIMDRSATPLVIVNSLGGIELPPTSPLSNVGGTGTYESESAGQAADLAFTELLLRLVGTVKP